MRSPRIPFRPTAVVIQTFDDRCIVFVTSVASRQQSPARSHGSQTRPGAQRCGCRVTRSGPGRHHVLPDCASAGRVSSSIVPRSCPQGGYDSVSRSIFSSYVVHLWWKPLILELSASDFYWSPHSTSTHVRVTFRPIFNRIPDTRERIAIGMMAKPLTPRPFK